MPDEYTQVMEMVRNGNCSAIEAERLVFDTDHTEIGSWMAERWNLPPELVQSIGFHHAEDISALPHFPELPERIEAPVLLKVGDDVSTDEISPAGARALPFRSNIPKLAEFTFTQIDQDYPRKAAELAQASGHVVVTRLVQEAARYLASRIPGARFVELPGVGHLALGGAGDRIFVETHRFLTDVGSPRLGRGRAGAHARNRAVHRHR
jgi:hypothetical protein